MARQLKPCGTPAAYIRHLRHGERPCFECSEANRRRGEQQRRAVGKLVKNRPACGTETGWYAHRWRKQIPCEACRLAFNAARTRRRHAARVGQVARAWLTA